MAPSMLPSLSPEILDQIIDEISDTPHLQIPKLLDVLLNNPRIAVHIQRLELSCEPNTGEDSEEDEEMHHPTDELDFLIASIIAKFSNLRSLYPCAMWGSDSWACFTTQTQTALFDPSHYKTKIVAHFAIMIKTCAHSLRRLIVIHNLSKDTGKPFTSDTISYQWFSKPPPYIHGR
ncbi:hypothetical protein BDZ94DRAFT_1309811 [Collybia nuda]|uniref:Uncharacterized protein n=1 Tax=Collybia nuda TaxID=64659 RepID=A0A9P5Y6S9_9AGAR|nr:hypothetical protein BDZ94DRAFT_1309811 [Collybia nuda]